MKEKCGEESTSAPSYSLVYNHLSYAFPCTCAMIIATPHHGKRVEFAGSKHKFNSSLPRESEPSAN